MAHNSVLQYTRILALLKPWGGDLFENTVLNPISTIYFNTLVLRATHPCFLNIHNTTVVNVNAVCCSTLEGSIAGTNTPGALFYFFQTVYLHTNAPTQTPDTHTPSTSRACLH